MRTSWAWTVCATESWTKADHFRWYSLISRTIICWRSAAMPEVCGDCGLDHEMPVGGEVSGGTSEAADLRFLAGEEEERTGRDVDERVADSEVEQGHVAEAGPHGGAAGGQPVLVFSESTDHFR
ncbi:hypothetical protein [Streptomyces sp. NPDC058653]|uniref:hypothetical protein n=1 Tax=Streptomyces sp. NPDC058653 TaxID=3346576 RepID=UPI00365E626B